MVKSGNKEIWDHRRAEVLFTLDSNLKIIYSRFNNNKYFAKKRVNGIEHL